MNTIIIDDELHSRMALKSKLQMHCSGIHIVGEAANGIDGLELLKRTKTDLLFLDIEMPGMTGFELLNEVTPRNFQVIFITAFDHYAIKAIRYAAFDYLLKPIDVQDLIKCINKLEEIKYPVNEDRISLLQASFAKLALPASDGLVFCEIKDIILLKADSNYTTFYFVDHSKILVSRTLKEYEEILPENIFFRSHNSFIININYVKKYIKNEGVIVMTNGEMADLSRRKKDDFNKIVGL